ncbi:MAG: prolyl oligopeptidase family serine peptidase [Clostridia bacterium]|nr:prolyl oligopeptidase family serine peptidase [Clostridia bacterium]
MEYTYSEWNGFRRADFRFEDRDALMIFPHGEQNGKWMMKMEYFGAFPALEIELLSRGWCLAYVRNKNRWGTDEDSDLKARFADFAAEEFGLENRFVPVGMSCGGFCAVNFAARHPDKVSVLYLDAPVMNILSFPLGVGRDYGTPERMKVWQEVVDAYGLDISSALTWRENPMDKLGILAEHKIPAALIYGDSDPVVPYHENGIVLEKFYPENGLPFFIRGKEGCAHHPHGLEDSMPLADFIEAHA